MLTRRSFLAASALTGMKAADAQRPNFVFILTDDQRWDMTSYMGHPFMKTPNMDRLRREGVHFANAFVTLSLCSPSRASFLTGTYAHTNGVIDNKGKEFDPNKTPNFGQLLQKAGYETAYIGKWHQARHANPRPGFDHWFSFRGQGVYIDPELNENGRDFKATGYMTDLLADAAVKFIAKERSKPFCMVLGHKAIHGPFTPAERHRELFRDIKVAEPPNYNDDLASKPAWQRKKLPADNPPARIEQPKWDPNKGDQYLDYYRTLLAVDDGVGKVYDALKARGVLDNTVIVFASDNGYFKGEHGGLGDKRLAYEEALRIPFLVRYPKTVRANSTINEMVLNIDLAPTLLELAGAPVPPHMQGMSFAPLLAGKKTKWRDSFLYEYFVDLQPRLPRMVGVRTRDAKLIQYPDIQDIPEMYDLKSDPLEMRNVALDPKYEGKRKQLEGELAKLMKETAYPPGPFDNTVQAAEPAKPKPRRATQP
jgi:N-acetylglucosamine-6-sulfatase